MLRQIRPALRFARGYAKSAKVPVQLFGLDGTYATALYEASAKDSSIESTAKVLDGLKKLFKSDPQSETILIDPSLTTEAKKEVISIVNDKVSGDKVTKGFLEVLAQNNRLDILKDIMTQFEVLNNAHKGIVEATVTSAQELDSKTLRRLNSAISGSKYVSGKTLELKNVVDPEIKGGLIVSIGDRTVDLSVASKLLKYNSLLNESI